MNFTLLSQWLQPAPVVMTALVMLILVTVPMPLLFAQENQETEEENTSNNTILPNGIYLYGQSRQPDQIGQEYIVFKVSGSSLVGALYMPHSGASSAARSSSRLRASSRLPSSRLSSLTAWPASRRDSGGN